MPIIDSALLDAASPHPLQDQLYNALDCCVTIEVFEILEDVCRKRYGLSESNTPQWPDFYHFSRNLQEPVLETALRGFRVDALERENAITEYTQQVEGWKEKLNTLAEAAWGQPLNSNSRLQLEQLFCFWMGMKPPKGIVGGEWKTTFSREALERLGEKELWAAPFVTLILEIRDLEKKLQFLKTEIDLDGRFRTSYNIAGTKTGRFSSSASAWGTGGNHQNWTERLRKVFVADPGMTLVVIDLEQAESREVGWLCGTLFRDWTYLDACESGDLHTTVTKMGFPNLSWTNDPKADKTLASETKLYRDKSYRDGAKTLGHGCLTGDHEMLTRQGWVRMDEYKEGEILVYGGEKSWFAEPETYGRFEYSGTMVNMEGLAVSATMTSDHRIMYKKDINSKTIHECSAREFLPEGYIPLGGSYVGGSSTMTPIEARLLAAFQADGNRRSSRQVGFHLLKTRKVERLKMLAKEAGLEVLVRKRDLYVIENSSWQKKAGAYLLDLSSDALKAFIDELKYWDGHESATSVRIMAKDKEHLEWLQTLGRLVGVGGNISKPRVSDFGSKIYTLQQNKRNYATGSKLKIKKYASTSYVFCPTVSTGMFYIRRKGKIHITGNSNYYGTPKTMAKHSKFPLSVVENFQKNYFRRFLAIPRWHQWVIEQIQTTGRLTTPMGLSRRFFGRPEDASTWREAIAFSPQSTTAQKTNQGMMNIQKELGRSGRVQLLAQTHDSVTFQCRDAEIDEIVPLALKLMEVPLTFEGRTIIVPGEAKVGWNWASRRENKDGTVENPNGLVKWKPGIMEKRKRLSAMDF